VDTDIVVTTRRESGTFYWGTRRVESCT